MLTEQEQKYIPEWAGSVKAGTRICERPIHQKWNFSFCFTWSQLKNQRIINSLHAGFVFMLLLSSADFFSKLTFFQKFIQEHNQGVKQLGFRLGPTFCWSWSGSKMFAMVISRRQKLSLARKELSQSLGHQIEELNYLCILLASKVSKSSNHGPAIFMK